MGRGSWILSAFIVDSDSREHCDDEQYLCTPDPSQDRETHWLFTPTTTLPFAVVTNKPAW